MYEVDLFVQSVMSALLVAGDLSLAFLAALPLLAIAWAYVPQASNKNIRVGGSPLSAVDLDTHRSACLAYMAELRAEMEVERRIEATILRLSSTRVVEEQEWIEAQEDWAWNGQTIVTEECVLLTYSELVALENWPQPFEDPRELAKYAALDAFGPVYWWDDQSHAVEEDGTIYYIE